MSTVTRLRTSEELTLDCSRDEVWNVLFDVAAYPRWWPVRLRVSVLHFTPELLGTEIEIKPFLARSKRVRFEEVEEPRIIRLRFFGGSFEGPGTLLIESLESTTRLRCEIDVLARGLDVGSLGLIFAVQKLHALQIRRWLRSVRARVATRHRAVRAAERMAVRVLELAMPPTPALPPTLSPEAAERVLSPPLTPIQMFAQRAAQWLRGSPRRRDTVPPPPSPSSTEARSKLES